MPRLHLELDSETLEALVAHATAERRPARLQAEVIIRQALGLPFPLPLTPTLPPSGLATPDPKEGV